MPQAPAQPANNHSLSRLLPWLILVVMLAITGFACERERQTSRRAMRAQFDFALRETVSRIEQRVQGYEQMVRGVQSLFTTTALHNRKALHDYVATLQLDANFSGIQAIGVVDWVPDKQLAKHLNAMHAAGFADYALEPSGTRDVYAPIIQREPYLGKNRMAPGSDVWTDPVRRAALERARDAGMAAVTGKVKLLVDGNDTAMPGFIMYLPVYERGLPRDTTLQRRAHLMGWVYASFHMNDFMASLYGGQSPGLSVAVFDDTLTNEASLLFRSDEAVDNADAQQAIAANEYMVVAGRSWTLSLRTLPAFHDRYGRNAAFEIALAGTVLSLLLALLAWLLLHGRARALRLASSMTEEIRLMAQHDLLTGLPNRALIDDRLNQELARAKRQNGRFAMLFVDLDKFKSINEHFGHAGGDQALKWVAQQLRNSVRASDTVGRMGGDEFVVLLAQLSESDTVVHLAEKVRTALKQTITVNGRALPVSCSIGVAVYPQDGTDVETLMKHADDAMYKAKSAGRNRVELS
ncbi:MAG: diguanylate cyclase [Burkholderiales bacterium]|nr:diguanylate cyclase [Burkholderiales bacterium]